MPKMFLAFSVSVNRKAARRNKAEGYDTRQALLDELRALETDFQPVGRREPTGGIASRPGGLIDAPVF